MDVRVKIRGKYWRLRTTGKLKHPGECHAPWKKNKQILINKNVKSGSLAALDVMCHELLHACVWDLSEETIRETATSVAKVLYDLGARVDLR